MKRFVVQRVEAEEVCHKAEVVGHADTIDEAADVVLISINEMIVESDRNAVFDSTIAAEDWTLGEDYTVEIVNGCQRICTDFAEGMSFELIPIVG